jgi:hypothetical protein
MKTRGDVTPLYGLVVPGPVPARSVAAGTLCAHPPVPDYELSRPGYSSGMWLATLLIPLALGAPEEGRQCAPPDGFVPDGYLYVEFRAEYGGESVRLPVGARAGHGVQPRTFTGPLGDLYEIEVWPEHVTEEMMFTTSIRFRLVERGDWSTLDRPTRSGLRHLRRPTTFVLYFPVGGPSAGVGFRSGGFVGFWGCQVQRD